MLEPAHLLPLGHGGVAGKGLGAPVAHVKQHIQKAQADAGHQNGRHGHQRNPLAVDRTAAVQAGAEKSALVFAKQFFHALQGNRVHVPGVARKIAHLLYRAVVGRVEAVVHAGGQAQGHKAAVTPGAQVFFGAQQVFQRVRKALGLKHLRALNLALCANDGVHRAAQHIGALVNAAGAVFEFARKAGVHAFEVLLFGLGQVQRAKKFPDADRRTGHQRLFDLAEAPQHLRQPAPWQPVGQQEVQVFVGQQVVDLFSQSHLKVSLVCIAWKALSRE